MATGKAKPKSKAKDAPIDLFKDLGLGMASGIVSTEFLSTGIPSLDWAMSGRLSGGGMPVGKIMEMFGHKSTGKSWLVYTFIAAAQRAGYKCILEDSEQSYTKELGAAIGIDNDALAYRQIESGSNTVEEHFELADRAFSSGQRVFLALDSLAALTTAEEEKKGYGERTVGSKARAVKEGLRKRIPALINESKSIYLVTNHVIHFIGVRFGPTEGTPGGGGFPFHSTTRLKLSFRGKHKRGEAFVGTDTRVFAEKTRETSPWKFADIVILWENGIEPQSGLLSVGQQLGVVGGKPTNGRWSYRGKMYLRSKLEMVLLDRLHEKGEL